MTALDVQVVAFGDPAEVRACLGDVASLRPATVVVVDHLGNVPSDVLASTPETRVIVVHDPTNPGFGAGHNRALRAGLSPFVLLVNPDARVDADGIHAGLQWLRTRPHVAAVQGTIVNLATGEPERSQGVELGPLHLVGRALHLRRLLGVAVVRRVAARTVLRDHVERAPAEAVEVASLAATALLVRREAIEQVGGFDESYFLYGEELDLCWRLRTAGWVLVALPDRFATHVSGGSSSNSWQRELQWWQGTLQFASQWWPARSFAAATVAAVTVWMRLSLLRPRAAGRALEALVLRPLRRRWRAEVSAAVR